MVYTASFGIALGPAFTGIADMRAQLLDTAGATVGAAVSTGFVEIGSGFYTWVYASIPDSHRGSVKFYQNASPATILAVTAINPQELENSDAKTSSRGTDAGAAAAVGTRTVAGAHTYDEAQRLLLASQGGMTSGAGVGPGQFIIRDLDDTKNVVVADYDASGNRTAVTTDLT